MKRAHLLPAAFLADRIAGDPEWFPHPVRLMGKAISRGEDVLRDPEQGDAAQFFAGAILTAGIVTVTYVLTAKILQQAKVRSTHLGDCVEVLLAWTCLAARNLEQEAMSVTGALADGDVARARMRLARIVGRDTDSLDEAEICRAVIETLAESASDGVVAPLFYMALGGVPMAMAYKAVNTLDSMIGHTDARYLYYGKAAARLDDIANFIPARMTAFALVAASCVSREADPRAALQICNRDGYKHKSPNSGQPEAAIAGALHVRLGGGNRYDGEFVPAEFMGAEYSAATFPKATKAIRLVGLAGLLGMVSGIAIATIFEARRKA